MAGKKIVLYICLAAMCVMTGCASLAGVGGKDSFSCPTPDGVSCHSVTSVYKASQANILPSQTQDRADMASLMSEATTKQTASVPYITPTTSQVSPAQLPTMSNGTPILSSPNVLRIWMAPWEDASGAFHDQQYVYLNISNIQWNVEHIKDTIVNTYQPKKVFLPSTDKGKPSTGSKDDQTASSNVSSGSSLKRSVIPQQPSGRGLSMEQQVPVQQPMTSNTHGK